jgi:hypothetical protein
VIVKSERDARCDLAEQRRRAHRAEHRLAAGAAEGGADVGALARLQQDDAMMAKHMSTWMIVSAMTI